ncbi:Coenzyme Q-binding protein coq10a, mitochondrial [Gamsiella multidivaricata]|nr:Coenzyme Q-binding protein coq10a, mitochondrial [Gamsiella multidivaricata]
MQGFVRGAAPWLTRSSSQQGQRLGLPRHSVAFSGHRRHEHPRHFITLPKLPDLPNLLKPISSSRQYKDRTLVKYSQQEFYSLVANVDDYHYFLPWCTHSKMSDPLPAGSEQVTVAGSGAGPSSGSVTVRHGELGIGFNSLQERYVSTVTCQEPWAVRAVSYDSKLFKELSTTWKFTPNAPKNTTLEAAMDQDLQETHLLRRLAGEPDAVSPQPPSPASPTNQSNQPGHQLTAAAVFGAAAVPKPRTSENRTTSSPSKVSPVQKYTISASRVPSPSPSPEIRIPTHQKPLPSPPKQTIQRTSSPSNLAVMKPSDYPSCWVDFEIQFEFASPVHASMSSLFFDQVSKEMLKAFVDRAEELYGKR